MSVVSYDPKQVSVIMAGSIITGFADGEFINASRNEDSFGLTVGTDGDATRSKSNNRSGTIVLTLRQGAPSNDVLSALNQADELNNSGIFSVLVTDKSGTSVLAAETAWIQKPSDQAFDREAGSREWTIRTDSLTTFTGGNTAPAVP